jgi:hypothetical protein
MEHFTKFELHDVLFGDVWLCSDESNMQLTVEMIYNGSEEITNAANYPKVRVLVGLSGIGCQLYIGYMVRLLASSRLVDRNPDYGSFILLYSPV